MGILSGPEIARLCQKELEYREHLKDWDEGVAESNKAIAINQYEQYIKSPRYSTLLIDPFESERVGPNSYDLALSNELLSYLGDYEGMRTDYILGSIEPPVRVLDPRKDNPIYRHKIKEEGYVLRPGRLYLGSTVEKTACAGLVPWIEGRSSLGRLGISVHATAGFGDDGFGWPDGATWTLEISVTEPVIIYPGMKVCQIAFSELKGDRKPYQGKYQGQDGPVASKLYLDQR